MISMGFVDLRFLDKQAEILRTCRTEGLTYFNGHAGDRYIRKPHHILILFLILLYYLESD